MSYLNLILIFLILNGQPSHSQPPLLNIPFLPPPSSTTEMVSSTTEMVLDYQDLIFRRNADSNFNFQDVFADGQGIYSCINITLLGLLVILCNLMKQNNYD